MSNKDSFFLDEMDPQVGERISASWPDVFAQHGDLARIASASSLLAMASSAAFAADGLPQQVVDVLNYALSLEYFEATFYRTANGTKGLIPAKYQGLFREIGQHESGHVALIGGVLGSAAVKAPMFDFTAGGRHPDVFSSFETFAMLSSTIEDVGVAAFKGQIGNLAGTSVLSAALQIHSVEARHASSVRLVVGKSGSEGAFDKPMSKNEVLEAVKPFFV